MTQPKIGTSAPAFKGIDQFDQAISLQSLRGKKVALYFYPKNYTPSCTKQACNLRDHYADLQKSGYVVIGVSKGSIDSNKRFSTCYQLPFSLLSDSEGTIHKAYGTHRFFWFSKRTSFLIDANGILQHIIKKVKTATHAEQILENLTNS